MTDVENLTEITDTRIIVTRLCKLFYQLGWVTGTVQIHKFNLIKSFVH